LGHQVGHPLKRVLAAGVMLPDALATGGSGPWSEVVLVSTHVLINPIGVEYNSENVPISIHEASVCCSFWWRGDPFMARVAPSFSQAFHETWGERFAGAGH
jgi:hypothetical protein